MGSTLYFAYNYYQFSASYKSKPIDQVITQQKIEISQTDSATKYLPVSWAVSDNSLYIKFNDLVYQESSPGAQGIKLSDWGNTHPNVNWEAITKLQFSLGENMSSTIFDLKLLPDKTGFVLVTLHSGNHQLNPTSGISYYNVYFINPTNKSYSGDYPAMQFSSVGNSYSSNSRWVPVVESISPDSKAIAFKLYGCWGCGGHFPETLVSSINTDELGFRPYKNIGYVTYYPNNSFIWKENTIFSYLPYPEQCTKLNQGDFQINPNAEEDCLNKNPTIIKNGDLKN